MKLLVMGNERIAIPELLFHPSDMDAKTTQAGLVEMIVRSVEAAATGAAWNPHSDVDVEGAIRRQLYENVHLMGGSSQFPGLVDRL